jgi:endonuclease/exonuclease/phosphatase family metal-dependent hydrolase
VATFNVHKGENLEELLASIQNNSNLQKVDLFLLQEIESHPGEGESRAARLARGLGWNYVYAPARATSNGGTHGLAILSRFPLEDISVIPLPEFNLRFNTRRRIALAATAELNGRGMRLFNVHLDTRLNIGERLKQLQPVLEAAAKSTTEATLIGGDFNTNPLHWVGHVLPLFHSNQAQELDQFMGEKGFTTPLAQAGATLRRGVVRFRADSIYPRNLAVRAVGVESSVTSSDHAPVWLHLEWASPDSGNPSPNQPR